MNTYLIDTLVLKMIATPKEESLRRWCEANNRSLFLSSASLTEVSVAVNKMPHSLSHRADALQRWLNEIVTRFADRVHPTDAEISVRAGAIMPNMTSTQPRLRYHDAILLATAEVHRHRLLTRREEILGRLTSARIAAI